MKTAKERIREGVMEYLEDFKVDQDFESIEEVIEDRFVGDGEFAEYEMNEILERYLDWTGLSTMKAGESEDRYVQVFGYLPYIHKHLLINNGSDLDDFEFKTVDEIVDWIDDMYGKFVYIQEELKAHFTS